MNTEEERHLKYQEFLQTNNLRDEEKVLLIGNRVLALAVAYEAITDACLIAISRNPESPAGYLRHYFKRIHKILESVLILEATGNFAPTEILTRSAIEYCATALYLVQDTTDERREEFEWNFVNTTSKKINNWKTEANKLPEPDKAKHLAAAEQADEANRVRQSWIQRENRQRQPWPNVEQLFLKTGLGLEYRTLYWRLSSQVHGDAEDLMYEFMKLVAPENDLPDLVGVMETEALVFSRWFSYMVFEIYLRACQSFCKVFEGNESLELTLYQAIVTEDSHELAHWMSKPCDVFPMIGAIQSWDVEAKRIVK
jgi:hypothetical protein